MKRWVVLSAAVTIQTCMGGIYAWSSFVPALREAYGLTVNQTQLIFGLAIASFTVAMVFAGRLLLTWGPRRVALVGGLLFGAGYEVAFVSKGAFAPLMCGIGLITGVGIGFGYVAALSSCIQWFPRHKGLATGMAVAGFGGGAIVLSAINLSLSHAGQSVLEIFRTIGWGYGAVIMGAALCLYRPAPLATGGGMALEHLRRLWRDPAFRVLLVGMFCGTFAGLLVIGNLQSIGVDGGLPPKAAALAISGLAVGNAMGRISWGWISDRLGYAAIPLSLLFLGLALFALLMTSGTVTGFVAAALLTGFGFGGCFVLYAAQVATQFGAAAVGRVYPLVFLLYGLSGIMGPPTGGWLHDRTLSHTPGMLLSIGLVLAGAAWTWSRRARTEEAGAGFAPHA